MAKSALECGLPISVWTARDWLVKDQVTYRLDLSSLASEVEAAVVPMVLQLGRRRVAGHRGVGPGGIGSRTKAQVRTTPTAQSPTGTQVEPAIAAAKEGRRPGGRGRPRRWRPGKRRRPAPGPSPAPPRRCRPSRPASPPSPRSTSARRRGRGRSRRAGSRRGSAPVGAGGADLGQQRAARRRRRPCRRSSAGGRRSGRSAAREGRDEDHRHGDRQDQQAGRDR